SMIPGLEEATFVRYGAMHPNTFINSPRLLQATYQFKHDKRSCFSGQMTGVEGYVESAASGLIAGINAARLALGQSCLIFPRETAMGSLAHYITTADFKHFQPMNINFALLPPLDKPIRNKRKRNEALAARAL